MGAKPKLALDLDKITSGTSIEKTVKRMETPEDSSASHVADIRNFKKIFYKKLKSSPLNDYPMDNIEEMEKLLLTYGLLEPLSVSYIEDEDMYEIESGDRRYHSLLNLFQRYESAGETKSDDTLHALYMKNIHNLYINGIYCMVENGPKDDDSKRSRIIIHNETSRPFDPIRTSSKLAELSEIYSRQNKALPASERVNVNEKISQELNGRYGIRQIIRYKNFDSLIDELKNVVVKYNMNISEISTYHNLTEEEQSVLAHYIEECYSEGRPADLPTIDSIKEIVAATHNEIQEQFTTDYNTENITTETDIEHISPEKNILDSVSNDDSNSLQNLKIRAAKKIIEEKDKKELKIKETVDTIRKKSQNLEKVVLSYITESDDPQINIDEVISGIDSIVEKLNSIKATLAQ